MSEAQQTGQHATLFNTGGHMVSGVSSNGSMMSVMIGMGSDSKVISDKIFAKLDSEMLRVLNAPDNGDESPVTRELAKSDNSRSAPVSRNSPENVELSSVEWQERARAAHATFERQMQQIHARLGGSLAQARAQDTHSTSANAIHGSQTASMATDLHTLLARISTPADGSITSIESLAYVAAQASALISPNAMHKPASIRAAPAEATPTDHQAHALQAYRTLSGIVTMPIGVSGGIAMAA